MGDRRPRPVVRSGHGQPRCPPKVDSRPLGRCRGLPTAAAAEALTPFGGQAWQLAHAPVARSLFEISLSRKPGPGPRWRSHEKQLPRARGRKRACRLITCPDLKKRRYPPSWASWWVWHSGLRGPRTLFFLINRVLRAVSFSAGLSGMAPTGAGLSGLPTCRQGAICPGLGAP